MRKIKPIFSRKGFTIIELLIVVAIMVIMSALVLPRLLSSNIRKEFDSTVETIFYSLNQARERAIAWEKGTTWGVFFERKDPAAGCASQPHFGIFFTNSGYDEAEKINYVSYLPLTMDFDVTSTWGTYTGCYRIIDFKEVTGERWYADGLAGASTSSVKVYVIKNPSISSTISVTLLGMVSYTTSSAQ